jgi:hypothetical protein
MTTHDPAPAPEVARGEKLLHERDPNGDCRLCGTWLLFRAVPNQECPRLLRLALDRAQGERDRMALALRLIMAEARNRGGDPLVLRWANLAEAALSPTEAP